MPTPKSVVKISKNGVEFTSNVEKCEYYLFELTRAALRDVGKFVVKEFRKKYYEHFEKRTGDAGKITKYQVISGKETKYPRVLIGLPHSRKGKSVDGFYAYFQEFGAKKGKLHSHDIPRLGILTHVVEDNIDKIREIEAQYLSGIELDNPESLIDESEVEGDADD